MGSQEIITSQIIMQVLRVFGLETWSNKLFSLHNLHTNIYLRKIPETPQLKHTLLSFLHLSYDNFHRLNENEVRATTKYAYLNVLDFELR